MCLLNMRGKKDKETEEVELDDLEDMTDGGEYLVFSKRKCVMQIL